MILPVFTAHPSEARRRTVLEKIEVIADELDKLESVRLLPAERDEVIEAITSEIDTLWMTEIVRDERPRVVDEIRHCLGLVSGTLFNIVPGFYRELEGALAEVYPEQAWKAAADLRFGSWIGGDRDGNKYVTAETTAEAVRTHQETLLRHYLERVTELGRRLSYSQHFLQPSSELLASLEARSRTFSGVRRGQAGRRALSAKVSLHRRPAAEDA